MSDNYKEIKIPGYRNPINDVLDSGLTKYYTPFFIEADITLARKQLSKFKQTNGESISFTAWIVNCIAEAVSRHKRIHALPNGKNKLVIFDEVDISVIIEKEIPDEVLPGETLAMPYIIRKANLKSLNEIHTEIRNAQSEIISKGDVQLGKEKDTSKDKLFSSLPRFLRKLVLWNKLDRNAKLAKKTIGSVVVSSIGLYGKGLGYNWAIARSIHPLSIVLGNIVSKAVVENDKLISREFLCMTIGFQHKYVDGGPVARFIQTLQELMGLAYSLSND